MPVLPAVDEDGGPVDMEDDDEGPAVTENAVVLHEDKKYYPSGKECMVMQYATSMRVLTWSPAALDPDMRAASCACLPTRS